MKKIKFEATGEGMVKVDPDIAYVDIGVKVKEKKATDASAENKKRIDAVLSAMEAIGIAKKDLRTDRLDLHAVYDNLGSKQIFSGYVAENHVRVTLRNLVEISRVLDAAVNAGATDIKRLEFDREDRQAAYLEALKLAVINATEKVMTMAEACQCKTKPTPKKITDQTTDTHQFSHSMMLRKAGADYGAATMPGVLEVRANAYVEFELKE